MREVTVFAPSGSSFLAQLRTLCDVFRNISPDEPVTFNMRYLTWAYPLVILPIASHINDAGGEYHLPMNPNVRDYLSFVRFPDGVTSPSEVALSRTYFPICTLLRYSEDRSKLESAFVDMIFKVLPDHSSVRAAVHYPLAEFIDNIFEHSRSDRGYIFAQYYPTKNYLDMCVVDRGRGFAKTYKEERNYDLDDIKAMKHALRGVSTKPESMRGKGIKTSRKVVCNALKGEIMLVSGSAAFHGRHEEGIIYELENFYWKGVIVTFRIPKPKGDVRIHRYLE